MCVCPVSDRLNAIFKIAGTRSVPEAVPLTGKIDKKVVREIRRQYRTELNLCNQLFECAENLGEVVGILPDEDPRWFEYGLNLLSKEEYRLIRRLCEFDKHPCVFTEDGLVLTPRVQRIHPLAQPSDFASAFAS